MCFACYFAVTIHLLCFLLHTVLVPALPDSTTDLGAGTDLERTVHCLSPASVRSIKNSQLSHVETFITDLITRLNVVLNCKQHIFTVVGCQSDATCRLYIRCGGVPL